MLRVFFEKSTANTSVYLDARYLRIRGLSDLFGLRRPLSLAY